MGSFKIWIEMAIAGFVYVLAGFFLCLTFLKIPDLSFLLPLSGFAPYLSLAILLFSYVVGLTIQIISQRLFKSREEIENDIVAQASAMRNSSVPYRAILFFKTEYNAFVLFRLLSLGTCLLGFSMYFWKSCAGYTIYRLAAGIGCFVLAGIFLWAYIAKYPAQLKLASLWSKLADSSHGQKPPADISH